MTTELNETHDVKLRSWVESANDPNTEFPIQNLPFGVFKRVGAEEEPRVGVAIGDQIFDVPAAREHGLFKGPTFTAALSCEVASLNALMALGKDAWSAFRKRLCELLAADSQVDEDTRGAVKRCIVPMSACTLLMPVDIGDYTDFYASVYHATNVGSMFRPDNPLLPNYKYIPVAYHGRASSVIIGGQPVVRPAGQTKSDDADSPDFGLSKLLDHELEVGLFIGPGNEQGTPIPLESAEDHIFGLCLVNDWSARDIQKWEYQPLGPFLAKSFATTISPWIVTLEALRPFRAPAFERPPGDPAALPHLGSAENRKTGGVDITLEVFLSSEKMRAEKMDPLRISRGSFLDMYWTIAQMVTHHTSNGCNLRSGDLLASGTVSGESEDSRGSMLELAWRGTRPIKLPTGEERRFLQDGDGILLTGACDREGFARIGFGECRGVITSPNARSA